MNTTDALKTTTSHLQGSINSTDATPMAAEDRSDAEDATYYIWILVSIAFLTNVVSLCALFLNSALRKHQYYRLITCMSVSDAISSGSLLLLLIKNVVPDYIESSWNCLALFTVIQISFLQSFMQTLLIASERCVATSANSYKHLCNVRNQTIIMLITWLICVAYYGTIAIFYGDAATTSCNQKHVFKGKHIIVMGHLRIQFVILLIFVIVLYTITILSIQKSSTRVHQSKETKAGIAASVPPKNIVDEVASSSEGLSTTADRFDGLTQTQKRNHGEQISLNQIKTIDTSHTTVSNENDNSVGEVCKRQCNRTRTRYNMEEEIKVTRKKKNVGKGWHIKAQITAGILIFMLVLAYLPGVVETFLSLSSDTYEAPLIFVRVIFTLPLVNSIINPLIYLWRIRQFRYSFMCRKYRK